MICAGGVRPALAQTTEALDRVQRDALQQQAEQALLREGEQRRPPKLLPQGADAVQELSAGESAGECVEIRLVHFEGATLFPPARLAALHVGQTCFSLPAMFELVRLTTNLYIDAGYATSRAYLPEQDLSTGELRINVLEGRLTGVELVENGRPRATGGAAVPADPGGVVQLREFEQGLDQINALGSKDAKIAFRPGEDVGTSVGVVEITASSPFSVRQSIDNSGADSTGKMQSATDVVLEDVFGAFETIRASYKRNLDTEGDAKHSQNIVASLALPLGDWTFDLGTNFYSYKSPIAGQIQTFESSGESWTHTFGVRRLLHRDQTSKTHLSLGITVKETRNYLAGALVDVSSRNLTVARLGLDHEHQLPGLGQVRASAGISRGLPLLGVDVRTDPLALFSKFDGQLELTLQNANGLSWSTAAKGQWSPDALYTSEQTSLGGAASVRGFESAVLSGENAVSVRNEFAFRGRIGDGVVETLLGQGTLFGALDLGWVFPGESGPAMSGNAAGLAGGVRLQNGLVFGEVSIERALYSSRPFDNQTVYRFNLGIAPIRF